MSAVEIYKGMQDHANTSGETLKKENRWKPPAADVLKINSDGAFHMIERSRAWGFVVRDSDGYGVLAGLGRLNAVHDALSAEGECLAALRAATEVGISWVIVKSDSTNLLSAIQSSRHHCLIRPLVVLFLGRFGNCSLCSLFLCSLVLYHVLVISVHMSLLKLVLYGTRVIRLSGLTPSQTL